MGTLGVKIVDCCEHPPLGMRWMLNRSLRWIEPDTLDGVDRIELVDELVVPPGHCALDGVPTPEGEPIMACYTPSIGGRPYITLNVGRLFRWIPLVLLWTPAPVLILAVAIAHEVAHHLARRRGFILSRDERSSGLTRREEEVAAERYALSVQERMLSRWYFRAVHRLLREAAEHHYIQGLLDWKEGKYFRAAVRFSRAWFLYPEHEFAGSAYRNAKVMEHDTAPQVPAGWVPNPSLPKTGRSKGQTDDIVPGKGAYRTPFAHKSPSKRAKRR
jgi:hypothetical protein